MAGDYKDMRYAQRRQSFFENVVSLLFPKKWVHVEAVITDVEKPKRPVSK